MPYGDLIGLADAARDYQVSEDWLRKQVREKKLTAYDRPGDMRTFLSRDELQKFMTPKPRDAE